MKVAKGPGSILLVEDDEIDIDLIRRAYEGSGMARPLHVVKNGMEAMAYLNGVAPFNDRKAHPFPVLVLLDLFLPVISGFDLLRWMKARSFLSRAMVLVLSASSAREDVILAYELGAVGFVKKSAGFEDLIGVLRSAR